MDTPYGLVAIANTDTRELKVIPKTEEEPDNYLKRLMYIEYLATPGADTSPEAIKEFAMNLGITTLTLRRWKANSSFQSLLAKRLRDQVTGGLGLAMVFQEMMSLIANPKTPPGVKARVCSDLAKLNLKQEELYLKYKLAKDKKDGPVTKRTFEEEVEASFEVIADE